MHLKSYLEELRFIQRAAPTWYDRKDLLTASIAFHLNNGLGRSGRGRAGLDVQVLIGDQPRALHLRPCRGDLFILYEVLAREAYAIPSAILDPEEVRVILDCGANIGITALYFAERYRNARIFCVEADPDNFEVLARNVAGQDRIVPICAAVMGSSGPVRLTRDLPGYGNKVQEPGATGASIEVAGLTISDICVRHGIERIDLLKVDIEGAERDVFGHPEFLPMTGFVAIELHAPYGLSQFRRDIAPHGFEAVPPAPDTCPHAHVAFPRQGRTTPICYQVCLDSRA